MNGNKLAFLSCISLLLLVQLSKRLILYCCYCYCRRATRRGDCFFFLLPCHGRSKNDRARANDRANALVANDRANVLVAAPPTVSVSPFLLPQI